MDQERERTERTALTGVITCAWGLILNIISLEEPLQILINRQLAQYFEAYTRLDGVRSRYVGRRVFIDIFLGCNCSGAPERDNYEIREKRENGERKRIFGRPMFTNLNLFRVISRIL